MVVYFQKKGVVDGETMRDIYADWGKFFGEQRRLLIGDSARAHFTEVAKRDVANKTRVFFSY